MQLEATQRQHSSSQQLYFSRLMELHEVNYIRLRCLMPDIDALGSYAVSTVPAGLDMHYRLLEKCKYTLTFSLSYIFAEPISELHHELHENQAGVYRAPDLQIRLYQDAQLAEVISGVLHKHYLPQITLNEIAISTDALVKPQMDGIYARWRLNRFLFRWLGFCLKQGHQFHAAESLQMVQQDLMAKLQAG